MHRLAGLLARLDTPAPAGSTEAGPPVKVIFRKFMAKDGEVYALFPEIPATSNPNECTVYAHHGQHGSGLAGALPGTRLATEEEAAPLKRELERIGYKLDPVRRFTPQMAATRKAAIR
jgi:hypothetical protein